MKALKPLLEHEVQRRQMIRDRAQRTVTDPTKLIIRVSPSRGREIIRYLNDTIGMSSYELVGYDFIGSDMIEAEAWVPGANLAMSLKLTHNGL